MALRGLPSQLPEYLAQLPRLSGEINGHFESEPGKNRDDFEQLVKLKLRATEPSFVLPNQLRELIWRQRNPRQKCPRLNYDMMAINGPTGISR